MSMRPLALPLILGLALACGERSDASFDAAGLATTFDSTRADTVVARVTGVVPSSAVRRVVDEIRIAPMADDTSLFADVYEFDVTGAGELFVFDPSNRTLFLFDSTGALVRRIGRRGSGPGEFGQNNGMVVLEDGRLALWDSQNARVSFFTPRGDFVSSWVVAAGFSTGNGLSTDRSGQIYTTRPVTPRRDGEILGRMGLRRFDAAGALTDSLIPPDLPWTRVVYVASREGNTSATGPAHAPRFIWQWHPAGHFVSVSTERYVIESSRPGRALRIERDAPPIEVSDAERAIDEARITFQLRNVDPAWKFTGPPIPSQKPPVVGLNLARDGRIWVRVSVPSVEIPESELEAAQENRPPPRRHRDASVSYEVFEADGRFAGRVELPSRATWMQADGNRVWFIDRDDDGLPAVVRARIEPALR